MGAANISSKAMALSARLSAVQALYQNSQNPKPLSALLEEYLDHSRPSGNSDDGPLVPPDGALLKSILSGVKERESDILSMIGTHIKKDMETEPLLKAVLICGCYEILAHNEIDAPIIINDYIHVTKAFYEGGESSLVNAVLDSIAKSLRT